MLNRKQIKLLIICKLNLVTSPCCFVFFNFKGQFIHLFLKCTRERITEMTVASGLGEFMD